MAGIPGRDPERIELSLSENAMDSLEHGIDHLAIGEPRDLKNAVLHVAHAVELFLKARLASEHRMLIFKEPSRTGDDDFTVDAATCIQRLGAAGVRLDAKVQEDLKSLRTFRNRIEHHHLQADKKDVTEAIGRGLRFLESFLLSELDLDLQKQISGKAYSAFLDAIGTYEEKMKRVERMIQEYDRKEKDDPDFERVLCPHCWTWSLLIPDPREDGKDVSTCFFCAESSALYACERCGTAKVEDSGYCDGCATWIAEQD